LQAGCNNPKLVSWLLRRPYSAWAPFCFGGTAALSRRWGDCVQSWAAAHVEYRSAYVIGGKIRQIQVRHLEAKHLKCCGTGGKCTRITISPDSRAADEIREEMGVQVGV